MIYTYMVCKNRIRMTIKRREYNNLNTFYINKSQINNDKVQISGEDVHHIKNVLRLKKGEEIFVCDELGSRYLARVDDYSQDYVNLKLINKCEESTEPKVNITLFQGLPKQDKMDLIVQKCTELRCKMHYSSHYG